MFRSCAVHEMSNECPMYAWVTAAVRASRPSLHKIHCRRRASEPPPPLSRGRPAGRSPYGCTGRTVRRLPTCQADEFLARSPDELSLRRGDRIELIERDDDFGDGWFLSDLALTSLHATRSKAHASTNYDSPHPLASLDESSSVAAPTPDVAALEPSASPSVATNTPAPSSSRRAPSTLRRQDPRQRLCAGYR
jgi:hypothetical protein